MTDAERVLSLLIHDLRTPLGVAHGYLRLLRADKLPTAEARERALVSTQEALGKMSRLCEDAGAFLASDPDPSAQAPAMALVDRVGAALTGRGIPLTTDAPVEGRATVGTSLDRAGEAMAALLATRAAKGKATAALAGSVDGELRFACGPAEELTPAWLARNGQPFDPWERSQGLTVVLAHRLLIGVGGRAWLAGDGRTLALAVRMENA